MPLSLKLLKKHGVSNEALKRVFTCEAPTEAKKDDPDYQRKVEDWKARTRFEERVRSRLHEGMLLNLKTSKQYEAVDIAMDGSPIQKTILPLMLYAQGRIDVKRAYSALEKLDNQNGTNLASTYCTREKIEDGKTVLKLKPTRFWETTLNLVRSYVTRRTAAIAVRRNRMRPFLKYDTYGKGQRDMLVGDAMSQRAEMWVESENFRHLNTQVCRAVFEYAHTPLFLDSPWNKEYGWAETDGDEFTPSGTPKQVLLREGPTLFRPHPSRFFWDTAFSPATINADNGCTYFGYWDVTRFGSILDNPEFFNREQITRSGFGYNVLRTYQSYFDLYYATDSINFPSTDRAFSESPAAANDRSAGMGVYAQNHRDQSVLYAEYCEKILPKELNLVNEDGQSYPFPIWIKVRVAGDSTVVRAQICPAPPAVWYSHNWDDNRGSNISFAHELMEFQQQVNNHLNQLLLTMKSSFLKFVVINKDIFRGEQAEEQMKYVEDTLAGDNWYQHIHAIFTSFKDMTDADIEIKKSFELLEINLNDQVNTCFEAIAKVLALCERITITSPQEVGQAASIGDAISATESELINRAVSEIYNFQAEGIEEGHAALKRLFYENFLTFGSDEIEVPIIRQFPRRVIEAVGFKLNGESIEDADLIAPTDVVPIGARITGQRKNFVYNFVFTDKDGLERPILAESAKAMTAVLQYLPQFPEEILASIPSTKWGELLQDFVRLATGKNLELDMAPGSTMVGRFKQYDEAIQQMAQSLQQISQQVQQNSQITAQLVQAMDPGEGMDPAQN